MKVKLNCASDLDRVLGTRCTYQVKVELQTDQVEEKDIISVTITVLHMFKKLEVRLSMLSRDMEDTKKNT